jgi:hypothetical protein
MMYLIDPIAIGDTEFVGSNVRENDYPVWDAATNYFIGNRVILLSAHKIYQAVAMSGPHEPAAGVPAPPPPDNLFNADTNPGGRWLEVGATRPWKVFDGRISDYVQLAQSSFLSWTIRPGQRADSIALFGLRASHVRVQIFDRDLRVIYDREEATIDLGNVTDGWDFFHNRIAYHTEWVFRGLPYEHGGQITITIRHDNDAARIGEIVLGNEVELGILGSDAQVSFEDYSRKERDEFGNPIIVRRAYADRAVYNVRVAPHRVRYLLRKLGQLRATPAVYHGGQALTPMGLTVFGFFRDVPVTVSTSTHATLSIEIEGLT